MKAFVNKISKIGQYKKLWLSLLIVALALGARLLPGPRTIDDSYITFRYAQNILQGSGFVFNPGERVLGTTTPLYTLVMTAAAALFGGARAPFPWLALVLNAAADALTCLLLLRLGRRLGAPTAGWCAALAWAIAPFSVTFAIGGLETSLYVLLLTAAVTAHLEQRNSAAALLAALALLTRPDALLLIVPLMASRLWFAFRHKEQLKAGELAFFFIPTLTWLAFSTFYFGSPIPQSITAKTVAYHLAAHEGLVRLLQHYATLFHQDEFLGGPGIGLGLFLFSFLYLTGVVFAWKQAPRLRAWLLYPVLYLAVYAAANPLIFRWYLTPPLPALFLLVFSGAERILTQLLKWLNTRASREARSPSANTSFGSGSLLPRLASPRVLIPVLMTLPLLSLLSAWTLHPTHGPDRPAPEMAYIQLELYYEQAADLVAAQIQPGQVLAAGDVGVLGYRTGARILDTVGLNSPQTVGYYPLPADAYAINYAVSSDLIADEQPDWLVILEVYGRNTLLLDGRFLEAYKLVETIPTDIYGSRGMVIYRSRD